MTFSGHDLRVEDNLKVIYIGGEVKYFQIKSMDDMFYRDAHSAIPAGGTESYAEVTNLDPPTGQLYWVYKIETRHNVKIYIKQPAATNRLGTNKAPEGGILVGEGAAPVNGREVDFWIAEDYPPNAQLMNGTNVSITSVLWWIGKRFGVVHLEKEPPKFFTVRIGGIAE